MPKSIGATELSVGPMSSTLTHQTTDPTQPNPQSNRTPNNQRQTFGHKEDKLFHRNIMTSSYTHQSTNMTIMSVIYHCQWKFRPLEMHQTANSQFDTFYKHNTRRVLEFLEIFPTHDTTRPTKKSLKSLPSPTWPHPTQPNRWVDTTHRRLWGANGDFRHVRGHNSSMPMVP